MSSILTRESRACGTDPCRGNPDSYDSEDHHKALGSIQSLTNKRPSLYLKVIVLTTDRFSFYLHRRTKLL